MTIDTVTEALAQTPLSCFLRSPFAVGRKRNGQYPRNAAVTLAAHPSIIEALNELAATERTSISKLLGSALAVLFQRSRKAVETLLRRHSAASIYTSVEERSAAWESRRAQRKVLLHIRRKDFERLHDLSLTTTTTYNDLMTLAFILYLAK